MQPGTGIYSPTWQRRAVRHVKSLLVLTDKLCKRKIHILSIIFQLLSLKRGLFSFQIITQIWSCLTALKKILRNVSVKLLKNICSLEELITAVSKKVRCYYLVLRNQRIIRNLLAYHDQKMLNFFVKSTRNLLFGIEEAKLSMKLLNISSN